MAGIPGLRDMWGAIGDTLDWVGDAASDALKIVANGVNTLKNNENATVVITHYQRLLDYIVPDYVHILHDGKIVKSGDKNLALEMEEKGYEWITKEKSL